MTTRAVSATIEISSSLALDCNQVVLVPWNNLEPQPRDRLYGCCPCGSLSWKAVDTL